MGPLLLGNATQAAGGVSGVAGSNVVAGGLVEAAVLAVANVIVVLHAQGSPTGEMHREVWVDLKSFH